MHSGCIYDDRGCLNKLETTQKNMNTNKNKPGSGMLFIETVFNENRTNIKYEKIETEKNMPANSIPIAEIEMESKNKDNRIFTSRSSANYGFIQT